MENSDQIIFDIKKIRLIIGLGNTGREYEHTRHNVGFMFLDLLGGRNFEEEKKLKSQILKINTNSGRLILIKPTTFMNSSGEAVLLTKDYYKIRNDEILVVHDDLDLQVGNHKIQFATGPKVHNGINSVENRLGTNKFWRLRIGVENRLGEERRYITGQDYVLSNFINDEVNQITDLSETIIKKWRFDLEESTDTHLNAVG